LDGFGVLDGCWGVLMDCGEFGWMFWEFGCMLGWMVVGVDVWVFGWMFGWLVVCLDGCLGVWMDVGVD
jgi:hypothetical protein